MPAEPVFSEFTEPSTCESRLPWKYCLTCLSTITTPETMWESRSISCEAGSEDVARYW